MELPEDVLRWVMTHFKEADRENALARRDYVWRIWSQAGQAGAGV
jgi:hypothetical protein